MDFPELWKPQPWAGELQGEHLPRSEPPLLTVSYTEDRPFSQTEKRLINHKEENPSGAQVCVNIYWAVWAAVI